jgi:rhodanese-related sulfurtransferase
VGRWTKSGRRARRRAWARMRAVGGIGGVGGGSAARMGRMTIDEVLAAARSGLCRLRPVQVLAAIGSGPALIGISSDSQIARDGTIAGALVIACNVLERRLNLAAQHCCPQARHLGERVIVLCDVGYQPGLAAATLQQLGFACASDVDRGFRAWRQAGLPVNLPEAPGDYVDRQRAGTAITPDPEHRQLAHRMGVRALPVQRGPDISCNVSRPDAGAQGDLAGALRVVGLRRTWRPLR